ncbi:antibiotic biosynthesis monooxygenase [Methylophaga sp. 41_12_T18]|nr:antibiotic biosynthesis monooxygenase [Methylophaga sp. 41_12_T18]
MSKVTLEGYIVVPDSELSAVTSELTRHIELTRQEEGCVIFDVSPDQKNKNIFHVYEEFINRDAFELHQARVKQSRWAQVTADVERHYKVTEATAKLT